LLQLAGDNTIMLPKGTEGNYLPTARGRYLAIAKMGSRDLMVMPNGDLILMPDASVALTTVPSTSKAINTMPVTSNALTVIPKTTKAITTMPVTSNALTVMPETTKAITTMPVTSNALTVMPETSKAITTVPVTSNALTVIPETSKALTTLPTYEQTLQQANQAMPYKEVSGEVENNNITEGAEDSGKIVEEGNNTGFTYKNNPLDNPKAAKDVVENQNAVYGFSPNPKSERIGKFAEFDWTNKNIVSSAREARLQYHKDNESIYNLVKEMQHNGATVEEIARAANQQRNLNRLQSYIDTGNISGYEKAVESNMKNFQNELGMTAEQAYEKYGSWNIVLEKAMSANAGMDACCGLYDDFYYLYLMGGN